MIGRQKQIDPNTRKVLRGMVRIWVRHNSFMQDIGERRAVDAVVSLIEAGYFYIACDEETKDGTLVNLRIEPNFDFLK